MKAYAKLVLAFLLSAGLLVPVVEAAIQYVVTDLGTLGGANSYACSINEQGQVVGSSYVAGDVYEHAFIYTNGAMTDLSTLAWGNWSTGVGINNLGQVVGTSGSLGGVYHAFVWSDGHMQDLGTLHGGTQEISLAYKINDHGVIVGACNDRATKWEGGVVTDITPNPPNAASVAYGLNEAGTISGWYTEYPISTGFLWNNGSVSEMSLPVGESASVVYSINDYGQAVGETFGSADSYDAKHAAFWDGSTVQQITTGTDYSRAFAINNHGQVVGSTYVDYPYFANDQLRRGFLWQSGNFYDLNDYISVNSGWIVSGASDINDSGWIVGTGIRPDGSSHAILLTPIPEPATFTLLAVAGLSLTRRWRYSGRMR